MPIVPPVVRAGTRDLPHVPPLVQYLVGTFLTPILAWLSTLVYRPLLHRCADHPLVLLAQCYDPAAVVAACAAYHHAPTAPGRPPTFTIDQFVRAEIVRAWADSCSDPALEELLTTNLLVRWFVGLPLAAPAPDHSTLNDFHAFLTTHAPDAFFRDVLTFLGGVDPEPPDATPQIVDTFAMASPAAATSSVAQLLRHLTLRLVRLWFAHAPDALLHAVPPLDLGALAHPGYARTALARQQHLLSAVAVTSWVVSGITPHLPLLDASLRTTVVGYLDALAKVQADELFTDASGYVQERAPKDRGERRIGSAVDIKATFRKHDASEAVLGSNAVISITASCIRAAVALTGSTPDSEAPCAVLTQQQQANQPLPPHLIMDQAGGWGKTRARVAALSDGQTSMVAWVPTSGGSDPHRFTVADFQVNPERTSCTYPNGVVSTKAYAHGEGDGFSSAFWPRSAATARCGRPAATWRPTPKGIAACSSLITTATYGRARRSTRRLRAARCSTAAGA